MKKIQDGASFFFIIAVAALTAISMLGVWDVLGRDVIMKSFQTLGWLALIAVIIVFAGRFMGHGEGTLPQPPNPVFGSIRRITLGALILSASLLAFLGIATIWELITEQEILYRSVSSLAVLAFGALLVTATCMERENHPALKNKGISLGGAVGALILLYLVISFSTASFW